MSQMSQTYFFGYLRFTTKVPNVPSHLIGGIFGSRLFGHTCHSHPSSEPSIPEPRNPFLIKSSIRRLATLRRLFFWVVVKADATASIAWSMPKQDFPASHPPFPSKLELEIAGLRCCSARRCLSPCGWRGTKSPAQSGSTEQLVMSSPSASCPST